MVRLCHVIDSLRPGGAEHLLLTAIAHLDASRYQHMVVALHEPMDLRPDFEALGVPVELLEVRGPYDVTRGVVRLARIMRRWRPDLVHTHLSYSNFFGRIAAAAARVPAIVSSLHSCEYSHWGSNRLRTAVRKRFDSMSARYLNSALIAVSQAVRDDYRRHLGLDDVEVIYNYIDTAAFPPVSPEASLAQRRALGWKADDFVIVQIARLAWDKGQEILVRALPGIVRSVPNVRALFVGEGPILPGLLDLARTLGVQDRLEFIGRQTATHPYLGMANVFVFPSVVEGLGIALLEAMAMGLPIVASRTGGILEVATDGSDALLVPPGDAGALADAIVRLHADPSLARRLGSRAQQTVEARFSARQGVSRLDALYTRLAAA